VTAYICQRHILNLGFSFFCFSVFQICNAVAIAGFLNATLIIPNFHFHSIWKDPRFPHFSLTPSSNIFNLASYLLDIKSEIDTIERWMVCLVSAKKSSWSLLGCLPFFDHAPNIEYLFSHFLDELQEPKLCPIFCLANQTRPKSL
jgi:hypothetical protein